MDSINDQKWMARALKLAETAASLDEVPVGAVIVQYKDPITDTPLPEPLLVAEAYNNREAAQNPVGHAELLAIQKASQVLGRWRLSGCTLYVTLQPCVMCSGAVALARLDRVVFGASDAKAGATNHNAVVEGGIMGDECSLLLKTFFSRKR